MKKISIVGIVLLILLLTISTVLAKTDNRKTETNVSEIVAINLAKSHWNTSKVAFLTNIYDLFDNVVGYYYNVLGDNDNPIGYILVSADKGLPPVLQFGDNVISEDFSESLSEGKRFYYLGVFNYHFGENAIEVKSKFAVAKMIKLKNMENKGLVDSIEYKRFKNYELKDIPKNYGKYDSSWVKVINGEYGITSNSKELSVTRIWQRMAGVNNPNSSCGPAVGAMITNYYGSSYNVRTSNYYGGDAQLINHLYNEMNTGLLGTTAAHWGGGMESHLNHNYVPAEKFIYTKFDALFNWVQYEANINKNRPVALRFDLNTNPYAYADYHFVAGIGYKYVGEEGYAGIKDPDGGQNNTGTIWIYWGTNDTDMTMIIPYYQYY